MDDTLDVEAWQSAFDWLRSRGQRVNAVGKHVCLYPQEQLLSAILYRPGAAAATRPLHFKETSPTFRKDVLDAIGPFVERPSNKLDPRGWAYYRIKDWPGFMEALEPFTDASPQPTSGKNAPITQSQIAAACTVAGKVYAGEMTARDGVALLSDKVALNEVSARIFIADYRYLMEGKVFQQRAMSAPAMRYFLEQIFRRHGASALARALASLRLHVEYYEGHYKRNAYAMRVVCSEFETLVSAPKTVDELEHKLSAEVASSLGEPRHVRLNRLAKASKTPKSVSVQSAIFMRNPDVIAEALFRASGVCERCKGEAPFLRATDGTPYLEVHHKVRLSDGGDDSIDNAIAICPNCHRRAHYGPVDCCP